MNEIFPEGWRNLADLPDVQSQLPKVDLAVDLVGVKGLWLPLGMPVMNGEVQHTVARVDAAVDLPAGQRGTHMSRLVACVQSLGQPFTWAGFRELLLQICEALHSGKALVQLKFPFMYGKSAPGGPSALMACDVDIWGRLHNGDCNCFIQLSVPVMTVCPCSRAISREGAHSQRATVTLRMHLAGEVSPGQLLPDLIALADSAASSAVYPLLKRVDEKFVTETAFSRPMFVEDVTRQIARSLSQRSEAGAYEVEVESMESIHGHNAFARIGSAGWSRDFLPWSN